ncbi:hypothetical protein DO021_14505 [Desulfobacter hydrogenophilus]|uniref:PEP-CTERM sorting domain-containing protein n=1 Tax=Desulfobacter hydrogenophilus TaxID=2291 RepID=A0A328F9D5_9BACT|nr:PEP-CTERM sorting domain-containing protein [Desulfobacter hydrogenophilus]NDY72595.1 PEP-CTERM sorting domain-containing protein [Desulfobacter hydrogenophilus]QBH13316.1 PEP-CTERM sorting domain-containing protein [Desulfobacter hydrogenophilus]RAM01284.1 hypothetical protein DO021_14505 [Desulfobacter hydrogenophilus]
MFRFKLLLSSICISFLFVGLFCSSAFSTTLVIEDGNLLGATDVVVNGVSYDVTFEDESAADLYIVNGEYTFPFTTEDEALAASQALLDLVFLDGDNGRFDSDPELTNGITYSGYAYVYTPYDIDIDGVLGIYFAYALNYKDMHLDSHGNYSDDTTGINFNIKTYDTSTLYGQVWAVWSPNAAPSPTPEPGTFLLLGAGLIGLAGLKRKMNFNKA